MRTRLWTQLGLQMRRQPTRRLWQAWLAQVLLVALRVPRTIVMQVLLSELPVLLTGLRPPQAVLQGRAPQEDHWDQAHEWVRARWLLRKELRKSGPCEQGCLAAVSGSVLLLKRQFRHPRLQ